MKNIILIAMLIIGFVSCDDDDYVQNYEALDLELDVTSNAYENYTMSDTNNPQVGYNFYDIETISTNINQDITVTAYSMFSNTENLDFDPYDIFLIDIKKDGVPLSSNDYGSYLSLNMNTNSLYNSHPIHLSSLGLLSDNSTFNFFFNFSTSGTYEVMITINKEYFSPELRRIYKSKVLFDFIVS